MLLLVNIIEWFKSKSTIYAKDKEYIMKRPLLICLLYLILSILIYWYFGTIIFIATSIPFFLILTYIYKKTSWKGIYFVYIFWILGYLILSLPDKLNSKIITKLAENKEDVVLYGTVIDKAMTSTERQKITVKIELIGTSRFTVEENFKIQAILKEGEYTDIGHGVKLEGNLIIPDKQRNPHGFNEYMYLKSRKIDFKMFPNKITKINEKITFNVITNSLRDRMGEVFDKTLPKNESELMKSMILGDKSNLDKDISALYKANGIYHIIVISGFHISALSMAIYLILTRIFSIKTSSILSIIIIIFYCLLTGCGVSTVRAVIMTCSVIFGRLILRDSDLGNSTGLSAILLLLYEPLYIFDVGFQLSFAAVFAIAFTAEPIDRLIGFILIRIKILNPLANFEKFRLSLATCIAVSIATTPIIGYHFNYISMSSVMVNLLLIPTTSVITISGFIMAITGLVNTGIAHLLSGVVYFILKYYEYICILFSKLPFSNIIIGTKPIGIIMLFYFSYALFIKAFKAYKEAFMKHIKISLVVFTIFLISICIYDFYPRDLKVTMLDVGQGDSFVIEKDKLVYIIDGGGWANRGLGENTGIKVLLPYLNHKGIKNIDTIFISHTDKDHSFGIIELMYEKNIKRVALPIHTDLESEEYKLIKKASVENDIELVFLEKGNIIKSKSGVLFQIISPEKDGYYENINEGSMVIKLIYGGNSFLFTGDIGFQAEEGLKDIEGISADVLKIAHHGSKNSTSDGFLEEVNPSYGIVSASQTNTYNHPSPEVMEKLKENNIILYSTAKNGAVIIKSNGKEMKFKSMIE